MFCLIKLIHLCLSTSTYPVCWKFAHIQPVPKKGDRSNPSNYPPKALISCLSKAFESVLDKKIMRRLSAHNLLSDCQFGFRKGRCTFDLLAFLTESWSSSFKDFGLDISKAFDRVWYKSSIFKLLHYRFYPSLFTFISSFFSDCSIWALEDGHCSLHKLINSGVIQISVLPTFFLLFINDLNLIQCPIHSYADDTTLYFTSSYNRRPTQQDLSDSRRDAIGRLTSDFSLVSDWGRENLVLFITSTTQFLQLSTRLNLPDSYPLSFTLNTLGLSFTKNFTCQFHIFTLAKSASKKFGCPMASSSMFSSSQLLALYRGLIRPCMEYCSYILGGGRFNSQSFIKQGRV